MNQRRIFDTPDLPPAPIARALERALHMAGTFAGATAPNPPVGCVLLDKDGNELAAAAHQKAGALHAEALALKICAEAGTTERIQTAVVTLEPCNHHGRTPPCTEALLATPVRTVWIACRDPNPHVTGNGAARLEHSGVSVRFLSDLPDPKAAALLALADRIIAPFAKHMRTGLPFVTVKQAVTSTGGMIPPAGRKTFTSETSLLLAHQFRRQADAILTGSGTILADNPAFTVRLLPDHPDKHRALVILDRRGRVPDSYLVAARERGFEPRIDTDVDVALASLGRAGCLEVLLEAGPTLTEAILSHALWDEHVLIKQTVGGNADRVTIRRRAETSSPIIGKDTDVLRHH